MKKFSIMIYINIALCAVFSLFTIRFQTDWTVAVFPLALVYLAALGYFTLYQLVFKKEFKFITVYRELIQFEPYYYMACFIFLRTGKNPVPYAIDVIQGILWLFILIFSVVINKKYLSEKNFPKISSETEAWAKSHPAKKYTGISRIWYEIGTTVDALVWAVCVIFLFNLFVAQLYIIPSESMVPTFLVKDRVITVKTLAGPKLPLTNVGLPDIQKYKRGDVVVFHNPHYDDSRESQVKTTLSNLLYMATFTLVQKNVDEYGDQKADPLVKRITGVPGEQLMLMDGKLYSRTADSPEFTEIKEDAGWAAYDLNGQKAQIKQKIQVIPLSPSHVENLTYIESERRNLDIVSASLECNDLVREFNTHFKGGSISDSDVKGILPFQNLTLYSLLSLCDDISVTLVNSNGGAQWFNHFMTDWENNLSNLSLLTEDGPLTGNHLVGGDLYSDSLFRLNLMVKLAYGRVMVREAELLDQGVMPSDWNSDTYILQEKEKLERLYVYLIRMDWRNMGIFPANDENGNAVYIPEGNYFLMGDNRFNSLDMRHSSSQHYVTLYSKDPYSIVYASNLEPRYVNRSKMEGKAGFRIWPLNRTGFVK